MSKNKTNKLYYACLYPVETPTCLGTWNDVFVNVSVQDLYLPYNVIYDKKAFYHSWICIHRAICTESKLHKMNKSNGTCKLCKMQSETICHLNYECSEVRNVWTKIS